MLSKYFEHPFEIVNMLRLPFAFHHHIVNVHLNRPPNLILEHSRHHPLISGPCILWPKWHHDIVVVGIKGNKCRLLLILGSKNNLMITLEDI